MPHITLSLNWTIQFRLIISLNWRLYRGSLHEFPYKFKLRRSQFGTSNFSSNQLDGSDSSEPSVSVLSLGLVFLKFKLIDRFKRRSTNSTFAVVFRSCERTPPLFSLCSFRVCFRMQIYSQQNELLMYTADLQPLGSWEIPGPREFWWPLMCMYIE